MHLRAGRKSLVESDLAPRISDRLGPAVLITSLSLLLFQNRLPDLPVVLIEPHRNRGGIWRIKFWFDADQPLSMSAEQARHWRLIYIN
jgi:hypothetical protein